MTHDELLAKIDRPQAVAINVQGMGSIIEVQHLMAFRSALRAVVELHKPIVYAQTQLRCPICVWSDDWDAELYSYPCPTIQAITEELK